METKSNQRGSGKARESERTKRCVHSSKKELKVDAETKRKQERGSQKGTAKMRRGREKKGVSAGNSQSAKTCY